MPDRVREGVVHALRYLIGGGVYSFRENISKILYAYPEIDANWLLDWRRGDV